VIFRRVAPAVGVAISHDHVRAVVLEGMRVVSSHEAALDDDLPSALRSVLAEAGRNRHTRRVLSVAVGPTFAQLRRLHGLPPVRDPDVLSAIVQQNTSRYFRQTGVPLVTTSLADRQDDRAWAGAIDAPVIDAVADVAREHRFSAVCIVPTAAVLGHAAPDSTLTWHDGDVGLKVRYVGDRLAESRCLPSFLLEAEHGAGAAFVDALRPLGGGAFSYADAYAAARGGPSSVLAVRPDQDARQRHVRRLAAAGTAFALALSFVALAPTIAAMRVQRTATARLATLSPAAAPAQRVARAVADSARLLSQLVAFQRGATSRTVLLASMSCAIEEPAMLLSLRLEPSGGTLTALAPTAAALLTMLEKVPEIAAPVIVGSVTPESAPSAPVMATMSAGTAASGDAPKSLERVTVRFQWRAGIRAPQALRCDE
jgi:hypothetical protein